MIMSAIETMGPWTWVVLGLVLIGVEILAPGAFLVWLGAAALLTGVIDGFVGLSWQQSLLVFAVLSVLAVMAGRYVTRRTGEDLTEETFLNRRAAGLVGGSFFLSTPIEHGSGQMRVGDSVWSVRGPDLPNGSIVRVVGVDGAVLLVEPA